MSLNPDVNTLPKLLKSNAEKFGASKTALRQKAFGIWQTHSWREYYDQVKFLSLGLSALGLVKGDKVAIMGNNRPASLYAELATQAAGGIPVMLYPDATLAEVFRVLQLCDVRYVVAENQEQVDKVLELKAGLPGLEAVMYCDRRGMRNYRHDFLIPFQDVQKRGKETDEQQPTLFEERTTQGSGDDIAIICMTAGATGEPRGAVLTHANLLSIALNLNQVDPTCESDEFVSFLPLAWFGEQLMCVASALTIGFTVNFPEQPETVMSDLREIGPHIMFAPPPVWDSIAATVRVKIMDTTLFKRFMYTKCMAIGRKVADVRLAGQPISFSLRLLAGLARICLFRALRDRIGLTRVRSALTGGSALGSEVFTFFHSIGINLKQVYGLTELCGAACSHRNGDVRGETVGLPLPGTEITISPAGEILTRGNGTFVGYYKDEPTTAAVLQNGWLRTGDAGHLDDNGHLVVLDRIEDLMSLSDGSSFAPQPAENRLKFSTFIREAILVGHDRPFVTALICIDGRVAGKWAGDNKVSYTTYSDLAAKSELYDLVAKEVEAVNLSLPEAARINRFALLYKELDADDGELTRTGKLRRRVVAERYAELIEAIYAGHEMLAIDATILLQDTKSARIQTTVSIRNVR